MNPNMWADKLNFTYLISLTTFTAFCLWNPCFPSPIGNLKLFQETLPCMLLLPIERIMPDVCWWRCCHGLSNVKISCLYDDAGKLNMAECPHPLLQVCFGCPTLFDKIWILLFFGKGGTHPLTAWNFHVRAGIGGNCTSCYDTWSQNGVLIMRWRSNSKTIFSEMWFLIILTTCQRYYMFIK